jgi:antitoxin component YwqK of YwqJK toxin-antitoxin module
MEFIMNSNIYRKYKNIQPHGLVEKRDGNNKLISQHYYRYGKKNGEWKEWYESGQLSRQYAYINDIKNGKWEEWYESGQLMCQQFYKNGKIEGECKEWYTNGEIACNDYYMDGKLMFNLPVSESIYFGLNPL